MKNLLALHFFGLLVSFPAGAHPASGIVADQQGRVFFAYGPSIVMVDAAGRASTLFRDAKHERFYQLHHVFLDRDGNLLSAGDTGGIWKITTNGTPSRFFPPPNEDRTVQIGLGGDPFAIDGGGNIYAINSRQQKFTQVLRITPEGSIAVLAGGDWGHADGKGEQARFGDLHGGSMVLAPDGALYVTDDRRFVRKVTKDGTVATVAGKATRGFAEGPGREAQFDVPRGLALDWRGNLFVADYGNNRIRRIAPDGQVTTLAGSGAEGSANGPVARAEFTRPTGVAIGLNEEVYVLEFERGRIRRISDGRVATILESVPRN